ncbi:transposase [Salinactinospora qingdaonensis]|uniref:transposase n=1 Tax=Salinactinospora qingdaonensis TaxID=702744 RepID=UPI003CD0B2D4
MYRSCIRTSVLLSVHRQLQRVIIGKRCVLALHTHVAFVTTYRNDVFSNVHLRRMQEVIRSVCADVECELAELTARATTATDPYA